MPTVPDLVGEKLQEQRFRMLEDIAKELSGEVVFPTCFDAAIHIRKALQDVDQPLDKIVAAISVDPLIGAKLLQLANSVAFNPAGAAVCDVRGGRASSGAGSRAQHGDGDFNAPDAALARYFRV